VFSGRGGWGRPKARPTGGKKNFTALGVLPDGRTAKPQGTPRGPGGKRPRASGEGSIGGPVGGPPASFAAYCKGLVHPPRRGGAIWARPRGVTLFQLPRAVVGAYGAGRDGSRNQGGPAGGLGPPPIGPETGLTSKGLSQKSNTTNRHSGHTCSKKKLRMPARKGPKGGEKKTRAEPIPRP